MNTKENGLIEFLHSLGIISIAPALKEKQNEIIKATTKSKKKGILTLKVKYSKEKGRSILIESELTYKVPDGAQGKEKQIVHAFIDREGIAHTHDPDQLDIEDHGEEAQELTCG